MSIKKRRLLDQVTIDLLLTDVTLPPQESLTKKIMKLKLQYNPKKATKVITVNIYNEINLLLLL